MTENSGVKIETLWNSLISQAKNTGKTGDMQGVIELFRERVTNKNLPMSDRRQVGIIIKQLADFAFHQGNQRAAVTAYEEAARYFRESKDKTMLQTAISGEVEALIIVGDYQRAFPLIAERTNLCRELNDRDGLLSCLAIQGKLMYWAGDSEHAKELAEQAEALARELGGDEAVAAALSNRGLLLMTQNDLDHAQELLEESERLLRKGTNRKQLANTIGSHALVLMQRGDNAGALTLQKEAADICREVDDQEGLVKALAMQAMLLNQLGNTQDGLPLAREADRLARSLGLTALADQMIAPVFAMMSASPTNSVSSATATPRDTSVPATPASQTNRSKKQRGIHKKPPWFKRMLERKPQTATLNGKGIIDFKFKIPSKPLFSVAEVLQAHEQQNPGNIVFEGPFPLCDPQGRFLCKNCGVVYDTWNIAQAIASLKHAITNPSAEFGLFTVNCRKCSKQSCFSPKEVITTHAGNIIGPWTKQEINAAKMSLTIIFNLSPEEIASITPSHFCKVLFIYR
jgi:tetratricopeptide (TPR) repeat protein